MLILATIARIESKEHRDLMMDLYEKYHRLVFHIIQERIDDPEEQSDIAQAVWLKLVEKVDCLITLSEAKQACYVSSCARNTALSRMGKLKREQDKIIDLDVAIESGLFIFPSPSAEQTVLRLELEEEFMEVWNDLDLRDRMLMESKYLFKERDKELAEWLGCKPSSVRMALTRAKRNAKQKLLRRKYHERPETTAGTV